MAANGAVESFEIERKYDVTLGAVLPDAGDFEAVGFSLSEAEFFVLQATYFDTPEAALGMQRAAVRLRVGGKDEGWHLKEKGVEGSRELVWPISTEMPAGLREEIVNRVGEEALNGLVAVATLRTERTITRVLDEAGEWVVELADDTVNATNGLTHTQESWREWEAELAPGAGELALEQIEPVLVAAGATRVRGTSKLQRALGRPNSSVNNVGTTP